ncbi:MAG: Asp-tRNA(Asn)/Glu-tRNA(Gln) amidotransferase subunit GatC [Acetobacter sp.]|nr:Asp-tRNA(Asn)/Glu-tRNA(Gln) amidotransferase subunit GatC [Acetobacter sp.]
MSITPEITKHIAKLARIELSPDEIEPICHTLNNILGWFEQIAEVCTDNISPMVSTEIDSLHMREDLVTEKNQRESLLAAAPQTSGPFYTVPRVVE